MTRLLLSLAVLCSVSCGAQQPDISYSPADSRLTYGPVKYIDGPTGGRLMLLTREHAAGAQSVCLFAIKGDMATVPMEFCQ